MNLKLVLADRLALGLPTCLNRGLQLEKAYLWALKMVLEHPCWQGVSHEDVAFVRGQRAAVCKPETGGQDRGFLGGWTVREQSPGDSPLQARPKVRCC